LQNSNFIKNYCVHLRNNNDKAMAAKNKKVISFNGTQEIFDALSNHPKVEKYENKSHYLRSLLEKDLNIKKNAAK